MVPLLHRNAWPGGGHARSTWTLAPARPSLPGPPPTRHAAKTIHRLVDACSRRRRDRIVGRVIAYMRFSSDRFTRRDRRAHASARCRRQYTATIQSVWLLRPPRGLSDLGQFGRTGAARLAVARVLGRRGCRLVRAGPERSGMHSPWVGVDLARDHVAWARLVRCAYDVTLSGRGTPPVLRDVIVRSWARCVEAGVDAERPASARARSATRRGSVWTRIRWGLSCRSCAISWPTSRKTHATSRCLPTRRGVLLWSEGHASMVEAAAGPAVRAGVSVRRAGVGTNAIGTALALDHGTAGLLCRALQPHAPWLDQRRPPRFTTPTPASLIGAIGRDGLLPPRPPAFARAGERRRAAGRGTARRPSGPPRPRRSRLATRPRGAGAPTTQRAGDAGAGGCSRPRRPGGSGTGSSSPGPRRGDARRRSAARDRAAGARWEHRVGRRVRTQPAAAATRSEGAWQRPRRGRAAQPAHAAR